MAVEQDDLICFLAVDLAGMAQTKHMLGVLPFSLIPHARLANHERLESFMAQVLQDLAGRNISVAAGAAVKITSSHSDSPRLAPGSDGSGEAALALTGKGWEWVGRISAPSQ